MKHLILLIGLCIFSGCSSQRQIITEQEISAPVNVVWEILMDTQNYHQWNPFITQFDGKVALGEKVDIKIEPPNKDAMNFSPVIDKLKLNRRFCWTGKLILSGLFDGHHCFELQAESSNQTRLIQSEQFSGLIVSWVWSSMKGSTREGFESMNKALAKRAETKAKP